jgi:hypothetical protein
MVCGYLDLNSYSKECRMISPQYGIIDVTEENVWYNKFELLANLKLVGTLSFRSLCMLKHGFKMGLNAALILNSKIHFLPQVAQASKIFIFFL